MDTLEFAEITPIEHSCYPHQASNGTIFYDSWSTIYVLYNGQKVTATESWDGEIYNYECFGDALYFSTNTKKIYTATFLPPNDLRITFIRELEKGENFDYRMLLRRTINGKEVNYRACDDPTNGISVDVEKETLKGWYPVAIHRGKLIYINPHLKDKIAINLSPYIIVLKCANTHIIANDDSPLVYFCQGTWNTCSLIALDTTTMETLSLNLPRPVNNPTTSYKFSFVGVHGGEITLKRTKWTKVGDKVELTYYMCKAKFAEALQKFEETARERDILEKRKNEEEKKRGTEEEERRFEEMMKEFSQQNAELKDRVAESNGK